MVCVAPNALSQAATWRTPAGLSGFDWARANEDKKDEIGSEPFL